MLLYDKNTFERWLEQGKEKEVQKDIWQKEHIFLYCG